MRSDTATVADLGQFDTFIDARSPAEFAEDHVPGALNCPVLDDAERARVGTLYKQVSPFVARRTGAALVAANIARHLEQDFAERPRQWRPLVYCWRGGKRSGSLTHVLREVGWPAAQLQGGYKAFRRHVVEQLATLPGGFQWRVLCGLTGSGKSRLIAALDRLGCQVLDLEGLAAHRGSVLGSEPDRPQPSQKGFETALWQAVAHLDPARPVFVESESRRIGALHVPDGVLDPMRAGQCLWVHVDLPVRVALLREEYAHFTQRPEDLLERLCDLSALRGHAAVERWMALASEGDWDSLVEDLLLTHYDPGYTRSLGNHYPALEQAARVALAAPSAEAVEAAARALAAAGGDPRPGHATP